MASSNLRAALQQGKRVKMNCPPSCAGSSGGRGFTGQTEGKAETMNLKQAKELVRGRLSDKRYEHTLNVRKMAVKLAKRYGVDEDKAALAALLHDSAKEISKDEMRAIMRAHPELAEGGEERPTRCGTASAPPSWPAPSGAWRMRLCFRPLPATPRASPA